MFLIPTGVDTDNTHSDEMDVPQKKPSYQADDKPWFNKPELAKMKENIHLIQSSEDAVRTAKLKYKVSKDMEVEINNLF